MPARFRRSAMVAGVLLILAALVATGLSPHDDVLPPTRGPSPVSNHGAAIPDGLPASAGNGAVLLARVHQIVGGGAAATFDAIENALILADTPAPPSGQIWDIGRGVVHTGPGVTDFPPGSDPDFSMIGALLTDGVDEYISHQDIIQPQGWTSGHGSPESLALGRTPDLVGYEVELLRLNITYLAFNHSSGWTDFYEAYSWEIWGHPLFVFFLPPTDPDGTYLVDRNSTDIRAGLAGPGVATLEWNGVNRSMVPDETNWSAFEGGLPNGAYSYRIWARNETGAMFSTPIRHLTVGVGIWRIERAFDGAWPSVAVNATGWPRLCYYGPGVQYAERDQSGWGSTGVAAGDHDCSLALNRNGEPRISFPLFTAGSPGLGYAARNESGWSVTTIDRVYVGLTSIAMNPVTDLPMISYSDGAARGLRLATLSGGQWSVQIVDPSFYGAATSLAIDLSGRPAISYSDYTAGTLRVARWTGAEWSISVLDTTVAASSIQFDASGVAHVAYGSSAGLTYATQDGTGWTTESVDRGRYISVSLGFDSLGRPHIGYAMGVGGDVRHAVREGTWRVEVISHRMGNGRASLAVMPEGTSVAAFPQIDSSGGIVVASDFIDTRAPRSQVRVDGTEGSAGWYRSPVTVHLEATDEWSGVEFVESRLDGGPWSRYEREFDVSSDGRHELEYRATDFAGNVEPAKAISINIDTSAPQVTVLAPAGTVTTSTVAIRWRGNDNVSGVEGYSLSIDGGADVPVGLAEETTVTLADGTHTIRIRATDAAGNSASSEATIVVDTNPFSFSGPYRGLPTIGAILAVVAGAAVTGLFIRRRRKRTPPMR